jgi:ATP-binding cassette subfamily B multidrug efflux pump
MSVYMTVMNAIGTITQQIPNLVDVIGSAQQSYRELIKPIDIVDAPDAKELILKRGAIDIKNVKFKYGRQLVLNDLTLHIKPGERVGLVGPSGAGKTTLVNMLMRFYDPKSGEILFDGQNIKNVTQDSLRSAITFIPQEPSLFNRSLADNIAYGKPDATRAEIRRAAVRAHADEFIMKTDKKYDSRVGDRGIKLSGGQKQRIAIARAFLKDAPILILDEATSALDSETEAAIQKSFAELSRGRTTIAIAHRLSTLRNMDRIVVIDNGKIIEQGTHATLLKKRGGMYAKLWKMQSGGFINE